LLMGSLPVPPTFTARKSAMYLTMSQAYHARRSFPSAPRMSEMGPSTDFPRCPRHVCFAPDNGNRSAASRTVALSTIHRA
jgi:hypothetical protein